MRTDGVGMLGVLLAAVCVNVHALDRPMDPVVLTGADVPLLNGIVPGDVVAFRYDGTWQQIPVQVDERAIVEFYKIYNTFESSVLAWFSRLDYVDTGTHVGPDPEPTVDADDEIVFMVKDAGSQCANILSRPDHVFFDTGTEVQITDPLGGAPGFVYLFKQDGTLDPGAGKHYVDYTFNLLSGDYKSTYEMYNGPNPEDSLVSTPYYQWHFSDRWKSDGARIFAGTATGVNILDRHKDLFQPGKCNRSEDTFCEGEGAFVANRVGPVRAIRNYVGANSGPRTQRQHIFYEQREDITTWLRVHDIGSVVDFFDYSPAASGMTYANNNLPTGVVIDGEPDTVPAGPVSWEMVHGPQGALVMCHAFITDIGAYSPTSYYLDDATPSVTQCTGDMYSYGASGLWFDDDIPNTDPYFTIYNNFSLVRSIYFLPPETTVATAQSLSNQNTHPLTAACTAWNPGDLTNMPALEPWGVGGLFLALVCLARHALSRRYAGCHRRL